MPDHPPATGNPDEDLDEPLLLEEDGFDVSPVTIAVSLDDPEVELAGSPSTMVSPPPMPRAATARPPSMPSLPVDRPATTRPTTVPPARPPTTPLAAAPRAATTRPGSTPPPLRPGTLPSLPVQPGELHVAAPVDPWPPPDGRAAAAERAEARDTDWTHRALALRDELEREQDRTRVAFLAYELGEMTERRLHDEAAAVKLYGKALASDPSFRPNLWAVRRVFYRRSLWPNLIKLIDAEVRVARGDEERADLYLEKGHVLEDRLKDREAACEAYDKALALAPEHAGALIARERLALAAQDDATLERLWRALADTTGTPERKAAYLVDLALLHAGRGEAGVEVALEIVAEAMALGVDRQSLARLRERLAERGGDSLALLGALEARVAMAVEAFGPDGPAAVSAVDSTSVGQDRASQLRQEIVALRRRGAHVAAASGDTDRAWRLLEQAAALLPGEPLLLMDLANLAEETGRHAELAELCARLAALDGDPGRQLATGLRRADALLRAGRGDEAESVLDQALAAAPGYLPVVELRKRRALAGASQNDPAALAGLASLLLGEAAAARLGQAFGPGAPADPDPLWAAAAYVAAGDLLALRLARLDEARDAYGQALAAVPGYAPALWAQVGLLEKLDAPGEAAALLEAQIEPLAAAGDTLSQSRLDDVLERLARLHDDLGQAEGALAAVTRLSARRPHDTSLAWRALELATEAGKPALRAELLAGFAAAEVEPGRRAALHVELGRLRDEELGDDSGAIAAYREALEIDGEHAWAASALAELLRRSGRFEELVAVRRAEAAAATDPARASLALREAAAVLSRRLDRPAEAAQLFHELAERDTLDPAGLFGLREAAAGDPEATLAVLERLAAGQTAETGLARSLFERAELEESLGRSDQAIATYKAAREAGGVGAHADVALFQLAGAAGLAADADMALAGMATRAADDRVRADLLEELAWRGLGTSDDEEVGERFAAALAQEPGKPGPLLGRALLAARRRDSGELASALAELAGATRDPHAGAALFLRAATLTAGGGASAELVARAARLLPEDAVVAFEAGERPAGSALSASERAALLARRAEATADPALRRVFDLERAEEAEAAGRLADAGRVLGELAGRFPADLEILWALRRLARRAGDGETQARAAYQLGLALGDPASSAACLGEAAGLLEDLGKPADAARLWRAVTERLPLDERAYQRAHALFTAAGDPGALFDLLSHRLRHVAESADEVPYRVERAALRRKGTDLAGAARDLELALVQQPTHGEALFLAAEVQNELGDSRAAAGFWERFLAGPAPLGDSQADEARLELARLRAEQLGDHAGAVRLLDELVARTPERIDVRERLAVVLEQVGASERAAETLEALAGLRVTPTAKVNDELAAARLYVSVGETGRARAALERARRLAPLDLEVTRALTSLPGGQRSTVLADALADARAAGVEPRAMATMAGLAELAGDDVLTGLATGLLVAAEVADAEQRASHERRARAAADKAPVPAAGQLGERLRDRRFAGALGGLWQAIHDGVAAHLPHEPVPLGFAKADRMPAKVLAKQNPYLLAWLKGFGLEEADVYVSTARAGTALAVAGETPSLYLGADVARGEGLAARARLGRALTAASLAAGPLLDLEAEELALWLAAAVRIAGADPGKAPALAAAARSPRLDERQKLLGKTITRRGKKALPAALATLGEAGDANELILAAEISAGKGALLASADVPAALAAVGARAASDDPVGVALGTWAVSEELLRTRRELGL